MKRTKSLNLLTEILLGSVLVAMFFTSFYFTRSLSPKASLNSEPVLGVSSPDLRLLDSALLKYEILKADENDLTARLNISNASDKLVTDYPLLDVKNTSQIRQRYALYFDLSMQQFEDIQLFLVDGAGSYPVFEARTDDLTIKDMVIDIEPQSRSQYYLRSVALTEHLPSQVSLEFSVKVIN